MAAVPLRISRQHAGRDLAAAAAAVRQRGQAGLGGSLRGRSSWVSGCSGAQQFGRAVGAGCARFGARARTAARARRTGAASRGSISGSSRARSQQGGQRGVVARLEVAARSRRRAGRRCRRCARPAPACRCARPRSPHARRLPCGWRAPAHAPAWMRRRVAACGSAAEPAVARAAAAAARRPARPAPGRARRRCGRAGCPLRAASRARGARSRSAGPSRRAGGRPSARAGGARSCGSGGAPRRTAAPRGTCARSAGGQRAARPAR